jgi:hypothetical protein
MKCPQCGRDNPPGSNFCLDCGARWAVGCASCGADLPAGSRFCNMCGNRVGAPSAGQARFQSPEAGTPKHLAEKILTSKTALEGERKQVTVLFADMKGSMELLADGDPEEARKVLDPVLELMMGAVHRYEGTVNQVMGDGIMALFGAPPGPRRPRGARVLRGAPHAGGHPALHGRDAAEPRRRGPREDDGEGRALLAGQRQRAHGHLRGLAELAEGGDRDGVATLALEVIGGDRDGVATLALEVIGQIDLPGRRSAGGDRHEDGTGFCVQLERTSMVSQSETVPSTRMWVGGSPPMPRTDVMVTAMRILRRTTARSSRSSVASRYQASGPNL